LSTKRGLCKRKNQSRERLLSELKYLALAGVSSRMNLDLGSLEVNVDWSVQSGGRYVIAVAEVAATIDDPTRGIQGVNLNFNFTSQVAIFSFALIATYMHCSMACSFLLGSSVFCSIASCPPMISPDQFSTPQFHSVPSLEIKHDFRCLTIEGYR
jgi:hypothetical protein